MDLDAPTSALFSGMAGLARTPRTPPTAERIGFEDATAPELTTATLPPLSGELAFASPEAQQQRRAELLGAGALVVAVAPVDRAAPVHGRLAEHIDERIERELAARGAPSPYLASWSAMPDDVDARLADQLFRARSVGATGIALLFGPLTRGDAPLGVDDSAALRVLARSAVDRPLVVLLDDADRSLRAYEAPVPVTRWLRPSEPPAAASPAIASLVAPTSEDAPPTQPSVPTSSVESCLERGALVLEELDSAHLDDDDDSPGASEPADADPVALSAPEAATAIEAIEAAEAIEAIEAAEAAEAAIELTERVPPVVPGPPTAALGAAEGVTLPAAVRGGERATRAARSSSTIGIPVARAAEDAWRAWALALSATRGPQPLSAFEKLFEGSYMPLSNAIADGLDDPRALRAHDEFRAAFERAYLDASATFGVTTRRPRMVMDAFDLALKHARAHNARSTQILLVDSLRADLAFAARDAVARIAGDRMSLTSEALLWSAAPTTTVRQLETLARGVDALRAPAQGEPPMESLRGRTAEHARRLRVGSRELFKLDVVPSLLAQVATARSSPADASAFTSALPRIGEVVGEAIVRHAASLAPRTLLYVVGDHGFTIDRRGRLDHGGAAPEEVLVPAQAWLVGDLH